MDAISPKQCCRDIRDGSRSLETSVFKGDRKGRWAVLVDENGRLTVAFEGTDTVLLDFQGRRKDTNVAHLANYPARRRGSARIPAHRDGGRGACATPGSSSGSVFARAERRFNCRDGIGIAHRLGDRIEA